MNLVKMKNVTKKYGSGHTLTQALFPTNFELQEGEFAAIIGPSGSGKTTFLTTLGNLQTPTSGQIIIKNKDTTQMNEKEKTTLRFKEFGFILQASNLIPFLNIQEQLDLIDRLDKSNSKKNESRRIIRFVRPKKGTKILSKRFIRWGATESSNRTCFIQ